MKKYTDEELENMSYDEIAVLILKDVNKPMKVADLFRKVIEVLHMSDEDYENHIADFFEIVSTDKNFIILEKGYCDLRINHSHKIVIDEDEEDYVDEIEPETNVEEEKESDEEEIFSENVDNTDDDTDDDLSDLVVVSEDDEELEDM